MLPDHFSDIRFLLFPLNIITINANHMYTEYQHNI